MSARTGISRSQLSAYENGHPLPEAARRQLADAAGIPLSFLDTVLPLLYRLSTSAGDRKTQIEGNTLERIVQQATAVLALALEEELAQWEDDPRSSAEDAEPGKTRLGAIRG